MMTSSIDALTRKRVLIAEDDAGFRETLALEFEDLGYDVSVAASCEEFGAFPRHDFDYAVVDLKLGADNGLRIVESLSRAGGHCRTVVLTGYGSIATAVQATKLGAVDYLMKPASTTRILAALMESEETSAFDEVDAQPLSLARVEREHIESVIASCNGNISLAASQLGLHRQSLQRKLRKFTPSK